MDKKVLTENMLSNLESQQSATITMNMVIPLKHTATKSQRGWIAGGHFSPAVFSFTISFLR